MEGMEKFPPVIDFFFFLILSVSLLQIFPHFLFGETADPTTLGGVECL